MDAIELHGRSYRLPAQPTVVIFARPNPRLDIGRVAAIGAYHHRWLPAQPTVVICADGCDPAYIEAGIRAGVLPTVARWRGAGFYALADAVMPTFTNPNNLSIVTGAPPA